jgi:predicted DNA-binding transcriptional regulator AlpA
MGEGTFLQKQEKYMTMMFSVAAFCHQHGISRGLFYKLAKEGRGPKIAKIGRRTLISHESAEAWRRQIEGGGTPAL